MATEHLGDILADGETMKVGLYARVSAVDQHCTQQLTALRAHVVRHGWDLQGEYVDRTVSDAPASRPAMNRLMRAAEKGLVNCIVVVKLDRWGRNVTNFLGSMEDLARLGVRFIAIDQGVDTDPSDPAGKLLTHLLSAFSSIERDVLSERTIAGLRRGRSAGRVRGRPRVVVDRDKIVRMCEGGATTREIGEQFEISAATVSRILTQLR
jgi:DNA invertase Pin-like site-specific DNA recombinase